MHWDTEEYRSRYWEYLYVFSKRMNCAKNGEFEKYQSNAVAYGWYIWEKGYNGEPIIRWI